MKTNNTPTNLQNAKVVTKSVKSDIASVSHNIMFYVRTLNKLAQKNEFVEKTNVYELAKNIRALLPSDILAKCKGNEYFRAELFTRDYMKRVCVCKEYAKVSFAEIAASANEIATDARGYEIRINKDGNGLVILCPLSLSLIGVTRAYCYILESAARAEDARVRAEAKAQKECARANKKSTKAYNDTIQNAENMYNMGMISENIYNQIIESAKKMLVA